jgi:hypothetical protein
MFTRRYTNFWDGLFRPSKTHILGSGEVKTLTNLVSNGNFVDATGWNGTGSTILASNNTLYNTGNGSQSIPYIFQTLPIGTVIPNHIYAVTISVKVTNSNCTLIRLKVGELVSKNIIDNPVANTIYQKTILTTPTDSARYFYVFHHYANAATANGKVMEVQYVSCVDLTAKFGAGNEPSQTDYANWIATQSNSWFNTTAQYLCNTNQWF